jgi:adenosylcobinamide-GDP ribazoletransferase
MFYTRIPCPRWVGHEPDYLNKATRYFPLIGWIVGLVVFTVLVTAQYWWGTSVAVVLSLAAAILVTGAFHEDGFGDACDGFGGGWTKVRILEIMKDSRIGAYGAIGLIVLHLLKYAAWLRLVFPGIHWPWLLLLCITVHALARTTAISLSFMLPYAREDEDSKAKPIAKAFSWREVTGSLVLGLFPLGVMVSRHLYYLWVLAPLVLLVIWARQYFKKWLGGYTGDCLGAVEQVAEVVIVLSITAIWKYI